MVSVVKTKVNFYNSGLWKVLLFVLITFNKVIQLKLFADRVPGKARASREEIELEKQPELNASYWHFLKTYKIYY